MACPSPLSKYLGSNLPVLKRQLTLACSWPLNGIKFPFPHRKSPVHRAHRLRDLGMDMDGWDDELEFNTQFSSQWDGLCHVVHGDAAQTYNAFSPTKEVLESQHTAENPLPTIDQWHARGGIVARGVLIDFKRYIDETTETKFHPLDGHRITIADVEKVAAHQGVEFKHGDVLIIRTGYTEILEAPSADDFAKFSAMTLSGLHGSIETARWIWDYRFAAVAGDAHAFEALPPVAEDGSAVPMSELGELCFLFVQMMMMWRPSLTTGASVASSFSQRLWHADWRAVGSEGIGRAVQEVGSVQLLADVGTSESSRPGRVAAECAGHFLSNDRRRRT